MGKGPSKQEIWDKAVAHHYRRAEQLGGRADQPAHDPENGVDLRRRTVTFDGRRPIYSFTIDAAGRVRFSDA